MNTESYKYNVLLKDSSYLESGTQMFMLYILESNYYSLSLPTQLHAEAYSLQKKSVNYRQQK